MNLSRLSILQTGGEDGIRIFQSHVSIVVNCKRWRTHAYVWSLKRFQKDLRQNPLVQRFRVRPVSHFHFENSLRKLID